MSKLLYVLCWLIILNVLPAATPTLPLSAGLVTSAAAQQPVKVWVNTKSGVYHCPGSRYYGNTKAGEFMLEGEAQAAGESSGLGADVRWEWGGERCRQSSAL